MIFFYYSRDLFNNFTGFLHIDLDKYFTMRQSASLPIGQVFSFGGGKVPMLSTASFGLRTLSTG